MRRHKHLAVYGLVVALVVIVGALAIWSFIERQSLVVVTEPLPKVTIVTTDPRSRIAAAWVRLLTKAQFTPTVITPDKIESAEGVIVLCDAIKTKRARPVVYIGNALPSDAGTCDDAMELSEGVSPLLARLLPGLEFASMRTPVALLRETPRMVIDARWKTNARAAVMHCEDAGVRSVWFGFDPDALTTPDDGRLLLLLRTAFRWVAGQPVSDGAVGPLTAEGRRRARQERFAFSVDRLDDRHLFSIRMTNRGTLPIANPTVKIWLPPEVREVKLAGDLIMRRGAKLHGEPDDASCLISLPSLGRNEDRIMKLRVIEGRRVIEQRRVIEGKSDRGKKVSLFPSITPSLYHSLKVTHAASLASR
ncbi:MAG TPA: hypothetical protein VII75_14125 [Thermoanaerobaculia bacterium]|nr:hypothetical protein [Thermoanaerobaculia bacterium]